MKNRLLYLIVLISFFACDASKKAGQLSNSPSLEKQVKWHIQCLNQKNFKALRKIYADDFKGWAPIVEFESKDELMESLEKNYRNSTTQIQADIITI